MEMRNTYITYENNQYLIKFSEKVSNLIEEFLKKHKIDNMVYVDVDMDGEGGIIVDYTNAEQDDKDIIKLIKFILTGMGEPYHMQHNI